ncbi:MAG: threonine synthase [Planctomycetota bacterium]
MPSFVTHLESALDGTLLPARTLQTLHAGRPLWVRYDLPAVARAVDRDALVGRAPTLWRYRELLPVEEEREIISLGEGMSPLLPAPRLAAQLGLGAGRSKFGGPRLLVKDEGQLPTGSFKSRGQAVAISMAKALGVRAVAIPTAGNAGGAMAAYAARAGLEAFVFMPRDTPLVNQYEAALCGAKVLLVDGLITDCAKLVREGCERYGWFDMSTLKEPYRVEGKKTMGLELAEQLGWRLPDVIVYPTGGGTGLVGMWKAFEELLALGWLERRDLPRMVAVQSEGCAPIVRAFERGERFAPLFENAATIASGLRVPAAVGDFMILDAVRASGGRAIAVPDSGIRQWMQLAASLEGITLGPEAACCIGAVEALAREGWLHGDDEVVIFDCGAAQKSPEAMATAIPVHDPSAPLLAQLR